MMLIITKCITGFIMLIIQLEESFSKCQVAVDEYGTVVGNCNATGETSVPRDLGSKIQVLDISFNPINKLYKDDLKNYPNMWGLIMINLTNISYLPVGFFKHNHLLRMLNISSTNISNFREIPETVHFLQFQYCPHSYMNISHLSKLEELQLSFGKLLRFPVLDKETPLEVIDVKYCPLTEADYTQIAPFCHLRYLGLNSSELRRENHTVKCCEFLKWVAVVKILNGHDSQGCNDTKFDHSVCDSLNINLDPAAVATFSNCSRTHSIKLLIGWIFALFMLVMVIVLVAAVGYHFHKVRKSQPRKTDLLGIGEMEPEVSENDNGSERDQ